MAIENWGLLQKSQVDSETIEEAIARLIKAHDDDETSHLEVGQSLQSHKASEIIDHLALSVIADKIAVNQVDPSKFMLGDRFTLAGIVTVDGWSSTQAGAGSVFSLHNIGAVVAAVGTTIGNYCFGYMSVTEVRMLEADNPIFECRATQSEASKEDAYITFSLVDHDFLVGDKAGFYYDHADNCVYAFYDDISTDVYIRYKTNVLSGIFDSQIFRCVINDSAKTIEYYIDGVLVKTYNYTGKMIFSGDHIMFSFGSIRTSASGNCLLKVWNFFFTKEHT